MERSILNIDGLFVTQFTKLTLYRKEHKFALEKITQISKTLRTVNKRKGSHMFC